MKHLKKNKIEKLILIFAIFFLANLILNFKTVTRQGINYVVYTKSIPLYLKMLDFFDRHYNHTELVRGIVKDTESNEERVMKILEWTYNNIKRAPEGLPIIDDHVWHIIIRGYGVVDQFQDVFTTLCNYAKLHAFFDWVYTAGNKDKRPLSFVKLRGTWSVFDAYNGVYFKNAKGEMANIKDLALGNWQAFSVSDREKPDYKNYFHNLESINYGNWKFSRAANQSPVHRLIFWKSN